MPNEILLRCKVKAGMFSDEVVVEVRRKEGGLQAFIVAKAAVEGVDAAGNGRVRASVVRRNDTIWAVLPTEYRETIPVDEDLVQA